MNGAAEWRPALIALAAGGTALVAGDAVESAVVSAGHADATELRWISDVVPLCARSTPDPAGAAVS